MISESAQNVYIELLHRVFVYARFCSGGEDRLSDQELCDLMDACHNVPTFLAGTNPYFTDEVIREDLAQYDKKWGHKKIGPKINLIYVLDEALKR